MADEKDSEDDKMTAEERGRKGTNEPWKRPGQHSQDPGLKGPAKPELKPENYKTQ